jgi:hypothetical protein
VVIIIIVHLSTISACTISLWSRGDSQGGLGTAYVTYVCGYHTLRHCCCGLAACWADGQVAGYDGIQLTVVACVDFGAGSTLAACSVRVCVCTCEL